MSSALGRVAVLSFLAFLFIQGCAMNVSLAPGTGPLAEQVLEGKGRAKILILDLDGVISFREESDALKLYKEPSKVAFFREAFRKAAADPDISGVIVRINSPGGGVAASDTIYHEIMRFREKRKVPVYAYVMDLCASGGYYVASATDRIFASPAAITGSIGVIAMKFNIEGLLSKIGVSEETYKSGPKKDFWSPFRPSTEEEKEMMQRIIDRLYERFVGVVAENRKELLSETEVRSLADGRILTAGEAVEAKLIDGTAYLDDTIARMKKAAHVDRARVVTYARPKTFKSGIYSEMPAQGPQIINLLSINAEDFPLYPGVRFMYLWNP